MADDVKGGRRRTARRSSRRPPRAGAAALLGATSLGGALALTGILVTGTSVESFLIPAPAAVIAAAPPAGALPPSAPQAAPDGEIPARPPAPNETARHDAELVGAPKVVAFLKAMRAADVPTSRTGVAEVMVAREACTELAAGTSKKDLARRIPSGLPTVTQAQAAELVDLAQEHYC